jgi:flavin reductase (DIM6/NTAB) family NADH-FMN oxidoreductase RutF
VSSDPPVVSFSSTAHPVKGTKDSARNAISTKNFVVNIISEPWVHQAHATSIESPYGQEEWGFAGLTKVASEAINAPRVRESGFSMECEVSTVIITTS